MTKQSPEGLEPCRLSAEEQLVDQAREIHRKAMNCSDFAKEGQWHASEDVIDPPLHNYWRVTAIRSPTMKDVSPYPVTKALTQEPNIAGLLTFVSTALPQLCDLADEALENRRSPSPALAQAVKVLERLGSEEAFKTPGVANLRGVAEHIARVNYARRALSNLRNLMGAPSRREK